MQADPSKVAIVTGGNGGVGKSTVVGLANSGQFGLVIIACRSAARGAEAVEDIKKQLRTGCRLEVMSLDLSSFASVRQFVQAFLAKKLPLHLLVNNAGVSDGSLPVGSPKVTADGFHIIFQTNYLSTFLLTQSLLGVLQRSAPSKVVNVSSVMHRFGDYEFQAAAEGRSSRTYRTSKLAQVLYSYEFNRRYAHTGVLAIPVSPGSVNTDIFEPRGGFAPAQSCLERTVALAFRKLRQTVFLTPDQGAAPSLHAALEYQPPVIDQNNPAPEVWFQPYWIAYGLALPFELMSRFAGAVEGKASNAARDKGAAKALWTLSESLALKGE